jgi:hypothetical protein
MLDYIPLGIDTDKVTSVGVAKINMTESEISVPHKGNTKCT